MRTLKSSKTCKDTEHSQLITDTLSLYCIQTRNPSILDKESRSTGCKKLEEPAAGEPRDYTAQQQPPGGTAQQCAAPSASPELSSTAPLTNSNCSAAWHGATPFCQAADGNLHSQHRLAFNSCKTTADRQHGKRIWTGVGCTKLSIQASCLFYLILIVILKIRDSFCHFLLQLQLYLFQLQVVYLATTTAL